jgi:hypothetical protein
MDDFLHQSEHHNGDATPSTKEHDEVLQRRRCAEVTRRHASSVWRAQHMESLMKARLFIATLASVSLLSFAARGC